MNICVVGWYFNEDFMKVMEKVSETHPTFVVKHREGDCRSLPSALHDNVGLEFGAFQQYLIGHWEGQQDVLFIQDDTIVHDINSFNQIAKLTEYGVSQAYIFRDEYEELCNAGAHGRAMFLSVGFIEDLCQLGGFPYDADNRGLNTGGSENNGIQNFMRRSKSIGNMSAGLIAIIPGLQFGRRGVLHDKPYIFNRQTREQTTEVSQ